MDYAQALWLYTLLVFGIIVVPGMDMFYILANALTGGRRLGFAALGGVMLGGAVHALFGTIAVGVLAQLPTMLFQAMILAGALYMAWIGYTLLRSTITVDGIGRATTRTEWAAFRQGTITCLLNPKAYLFVLAVFPQFVRAHAGCGLWCACHRRRPRPRCTGGQPCCHHLDQPRRWRVIRGSSNFHRLAWPDHVIRPLTDFEMFCKCS
jgi:threonine/homoserine/homoserine lactone efflux protein